MKSQKNPLLHVWLFLILLSGSCGSFTDNVRTQSPSSFVPSTTPIITVIPFPTFTLTSSPTPIPELSAYEAGARLLNLLASNGDCQLPCLWGITPGKSTYLEARTILLPLNSVSDSTHLYSSSPDDISPTYMEGDLMLRTFVAYLYADDGIVSRITFQARELKEIITVDNGRQFDPVFDSKVFGERMDFYMLHSVLTTYGQPESVMLGTVANIPPREPAGGFHILLLYPAQGILIDYETEMHKTGGYVSGCPANAHVEIDLYPAGNADAFFASLDKTDDWNVKKNWYKPLEEATSMSLDEFYEIFSKPNSKCIETPAELWPTPEP